MFVGNGRLAAGKILTTFRVRHAETYDMRQGFEPFGVGRFATSLVESANFTHHVLEFDCPFRATKHVGSGDLTHLFARFLVSD